MKRTTVRFLVAFVTFLVLGIPSAFAQTGTVSPARVTPAELQRIQDNISEITRDLPQVRARDSALATELQTQLNDANDEAAYLKVKLRRQEPVSRNDYLELLDRVDRMRARARGESPKSTSSTSATPDVPVGTQFDVRIQQSLNSGTAQVEDRVHATTLVDLKNGDQITIVPAGSTISGVVSTVNKAGRIDRKGSITLTFDRMTINGVEYPIRATVVDAIESEGYKGDVTKIGAGAGVGAIIGGILGGAKGVLAGILIGGGGTIAATEGKDVDLPAGTVLRVQLDSGLSLR